MHSCPRIIPLAPTSSRTEHVCVGPAGFAGCVGPTAFAGGGVEPEARTVTSVGTPEGSPPVAHHEYVVPLTVPLLMPAISPSAQEHSEEGELTPRLGVGATLEVSSVSVTHGKGIVVKMLQLTL